MRLKNLLGRFLTSESWKRGIERKKKKKTHVKYFWDIVRQAGTVRSEYPEFLDLGQRTPVHISRTYVDVGPVDQPQFRVQDTSPQKAREVQTSHLFKAAPTYASRTSDYPKIFVTGRGRGRRGWLSWSGFWDGLKNSVTFVTIFVFFFFLFKITCDTHLWVPPPITAWSKFPGVDCSLFIYSDNMVYSS